MRPSIPWCAPSWPAERMRVVVAAAQPPFREGGAAGRTTVALLRGLAASGVQVHALAPLASPTDQLPPPGVATDLVPVTLPARGGIRGAVDRWRRPVQELGDTDFAARLDEAMATADVVHLEQIETACFGPAAIPTVLHLHYRALADAPLGPPWTRGFRYRLEFAAAERRAIRRFEWLMCNSSDVADAMRRNRPGVDVTVVPLPLDPADYPVAAPIDEPVAGLIGTATWAPTAAAITRLAHDVWPLVRQRLPDAELRIAGRGTDQLNIGSLQVRVLGAVPSAVEFITGIGMLLYPPPRGSGTKVKVLEALACGVPVVTTPPGAEGIEANPGLIVAEDSTELADAAVRLLRDPEERRERGAEGRRYVERRHAPRPAVEPLVALYRRMLAGS